MWYKYHILIPRSHPQAQSFLAQSFITQVNFQSTNLVVNPWMLVDEWITHNSESVAGVSRAAMASRAMALQRSPLLPSTSAIGAPLSSRAQNSSHFDALSVGNRQHSVHLSRSRVCCSRASIGDDTSQQTSSSSSFPPPVSQSYFPVLSCIAIYQVIWDKTSSSVLSLFETSECFI